MIANVPEGDKADVDLAVSAARRAFDERRWTRISPSERGRILWRIADLIERDLEQLAELESIPGCGGYGPIQDEEAERMNMMTEVHPYLDGKSKRMLIDGKWLEAASGSRPSPMRSVSLNSATRPTNSS